MPDLIQSKLQATVAEPVAFESGLLTAYAPGGTATALDIHVTPQGRRLHRWFEYVSLRIGVIRNTGRALRVRSHYEQTNE